MEVLEVIAVAVVVVVTVDGTGVLLAVGLEPALLWSFSESLSISISWTSPSLSTSLAGPLTSLTESM